MGFRNLNNGMDFNAAANCSPSIRVTSAECRCQFWYEPTSFYPPTQKSRPAGITAGRRAGTRSSGAGRSTFRNVVAPVANLGTRSADRAGTLLQHTPVSAGVSREAFSSMTGPLAGFFLLRDA